MIDIPNKDKLYFNKDSLEQDPNKVKKALMLLSELADRDHCKACENSFRTKLSPEQLRAIRDRELELQLQRRNNLVKSLENPVVARKFLAERDNLLEEISKLKQDLKYYKSLLYRERSLNIQHTQRTAMEEIFN